MALERFIKWAAALTTMAMVAGCHSSSSARSNEGGTGGAGGESDSGGDTFGGSTGTESLPHTNALELDSVTAAVVGIHGDDLTISVTGTQKDVGRLLSLEVTLLDKSSNPITFFDTNQDGVPDPGAGRLVLDAVPTTTAVTGSGTIAKAGRLGTLNKVSVRLISINNEVSDPKTATVAQQLSLTAGESCDPKGITNRCVDGLGCTGTKPKCIGDVTPTIEKATYVSTTSGGVVIAVGSDAASPLTSVNVEFFDAKDHSIGFDTTGSGTLDTSFISTNGITNTAGTFVWHIDTTTNFVNAITRLKLTPSDAASNSGEPLTVNATPISVRDAGAACDTRGFDACPVAHLCWPDASITTGSCQTISSKQTAACEGARTIRVGTKPVRTAGRFTTVNLWSPPVDCSTPNSQSAPDTVVHLKVTADTAKLLISTNTPETNVATVVYLLASCDTIPTIDKCSDRSLGAPSADAELKLTDVAAGDYYIVLENLDYRAGSYGLVVTAE
jgi:hypothetical protein